MSDAFVDGLVYGSLLTIAATLWLAWGRIVARERRERVAAFHESGGPE